MASCERINKQKPTLCKEGSAGVSECIIINYDSLYANSGTGISLNTAGTMVIGMTGVTESGYTSGYGYKFQLLKNKSSYKVENVGAANGNSSMKQTLTLMLVGTDEDDIKLFNELAAAQTVVIIKDRNGNYLLFGKNFGMEADPSSIESGVNPEDFAGATINLVGQENYPVYIVDTTKVAISDILVTV